MPAPPEVLIRLCRRLDPSAWDVPGDRARLRLVVDGVGEWDFVVSGSARELEPAEERLRPDARLCADRETWSRIGRNLRGGMNAFRRGRLQIRDNLHLGVGFLAATSGSTDQRAWRSRACARHSATSRSPAPATRTRSRW